MKTLLLLLCVTVVPSCKSPATVRDYFDLWFVVPKNPFLEANNKTVDVVAPPPQGSAST